MAVETATKRYHTNKIIKAVFTACYKLLIVKLLKIKYMESNEFRIGNIVLTCVPNMEIMIPHLQTVVQGITIFGELEFNYKPTDTNGFKMSTNHIIGISLTEEWLLKLGFKKNETYCFTRIGYFIELMNISNQYYRAYYKSQSIKADIKYVHQLQNLFFALTNEELL